jgi:putative membrane protein
MKKIALFALCVLTATSAGAQSLGEKTGADALVGVTPSTEDFVKEAGASDMFEIKSSQLAAKRGDAEAKKFAKHMIDAHTKTTAELTKLVKSGKVQAQLPTELTDSQADKLHRLSQEKGKEFTSDYDEDQVQGHKDAVSLFERYAKGGDNPALKDWAGRTLPTIQSHLEMAKALNK